MSKMEKLKVMKMTVKDRSEKFHQVIVQLAGKCPALDEIDLRHEDGQMWFVSMFGRQFQEKKLALMNLEVSRRFNFQWPENLAVIALKITGKLDGKSFLEVI